MSFVQPRSLLAFVLGSISALGVSGVAFAQTPPPAAPAAAPAPAPASVNPAPVAAAQPPALGPATPPVVETPPAPVTDASKVESAPAIAPPPTEPAPQSEKTAAPSITAPALKLGGGGILWFYQPTESGQKNNVEFYNVRLDIDADFGDGFAFHLEPRFRDTKLRSFFGGTAWVQEGYASYSSGGHAIKVGKVYKQLGLFWDNSFWGNVQVYDGLKLAPDYGVSAEGKFELAPKFSLGYAAQYFVVDGTTNVSLPGRDTLSIPDSRRRNEVVLRVDPQYAFAEDGLARVGLSGERLTADIPGLADKDVLRYGADFKVTYAGAGLWGEFLHQHGQTVTDYPIAGVPATATDPAVPGQASRNIDYLEIGAEYTYWRVTGRYNYSLANYKGTNVKEWIHVPALGFKINKNLSLGGEYVSWSRSDSGVSSKINRSLNFLLYVDF